MSSITPHNKKGEAHGDWVLYDTNGNVYCVGTYVKDKKVGLWEWYTISGKISFSQFYIID